MFDKYRAFDHVYELSKFHRIQGSGGLMRAALYVYEQLDLEDKVLLRYRYDGETRYGNMVVPMGWEALGGRVSVEGQVLQDFAQVPLTVVAHSPPGVAEGEVTENLDDCKEKILLTSETDAKRAYLKAMNAGALAVMYYDQALPSTATPYRSLFLKKDEMNYSLPALSVPRRLVPLLRGKRAAVEVRAKRGEAEMPVIFARSSKAKDFLMTAHICHPYPGANDNASGAGLMLELANSGAPASFLWAPEHFGTMAFFSDHDAPYEYGINLDMVGENQKVTGSTLQISYTPLSQKSPYEELLKAVVREVSQGYDLKLDFADYSIGSDHAVLTQNGVPASSFTNWPDKYYHSSEDFADKVSTDMLEMVGTSVLKFLNADVPVYLNDVWESKYKAYLLERFGREDEERLLAVRRKKYRQFLPIPQLYMTPQNVDEFPNFGEALTAYSEYLNLAEQLHEKDALRIASKAYGVSPELLEKAMELMPP